MPRAQTDGLVGDQKDAEIARDLPQGCNEVPVERDKPTGAGLELGDQARDVVGGLGEESARCGQIVLRQQDHIVDVGRGDSCGVGDR
jgi:hypothetical protein